MKKTILTAFIISIFSFANGQSSLSGLGLGFNYNGTGRIPDDLVNSNFDEAKFRDVGTEGYGSLNRVLSSYEFSFKPGAKEYFFIDVDVMQGAEYIYGSNYDNYSRDDTFFSTSTNIDINSSIIGLKAIGRFTTPVEKRFFYNVGLGIEGLLAYNVTADGSSYYSASNWQRNYNVSESENIRSEAVNGYSSYNLLQQVGAAWRLGKDETKFPLNKTYLELDFQINNNFTNMNSILSKYRTYGFTLSMVYELR
ncbi:MAG: hypothetical protein RLZZ337_319 [Bacteroidota bacterium]|jgi:hypothetical protein